MIGQLLCAFCCPAGQRIALGEVKEETDKFNGVEVVTPGHTVTISSVLRDVTGRDASGLFRLSCGHLHCGMPMYSNQEWLMVDGQRIEGKSMIAECR